MGIVENQSIKNSLFFYIGIAFGVFSTIILYPNAFNVHPEHLGLLQIIFAYSTMISAFTLLGTPNNLTLLGHIPKEKLLEYYNQSQFHLQLSVFEGFGCSLVESMMCNCIPIGTKVNIIPYIMGDTGIVFKNEINKI